VEDLLAELLGVLLETVGEALLQIVFELAVEALRQLINRQKIRNPVFSAVGLALPGAAAGLLSAWLFPHRLLAARTVLPGVSLLLAPLATGSAMHFLGNQSRRFGRYPSNPATFRRGALFAFSMALTRWWLIGWRH